MKTLFTLLCAVALTGALSAQQVQANARVQKAFSSADLATMTSEQIFRLNVQAERLCWFEEIKSEMSSQESFALVTKSGK